MPGKVAEQLVAAAYFDISATIKFAGQPHFRLEIIGLFYGFPFPTRYRPNRLPRMVIYGTNGALIGTAPLPNTACPACATPGQLSISLFGRYAHVYWIPLFPYSKPTVIQCGHCQRAWAGKNIPADLHPPLLAAKKQTRTPLWHWSGVGLAGIALAWGLVASTQDNRANKAYLAAPQAGDIYTVHSPGDSTKYTLLKVVSANSNTVEVTGNEYETDNSTPLSELNAPAKYSNQTYSLTVLDLQIMHNKGQLTDVDRLDK